MNPSNKAVKIIVVYDDGEVVVFDAAKYGEYSPRSAAPSAQDDTDQALEATGNVAYDPETQDDVVAIEPPFIPIMRSGHDPKDV
jgi:hypothetical protein